MRFAVILIVLLVIIIVLQGYNIQRIQSEDYIHSRTIYCVDETDFDKKTLLFKKPVANIQYQEVTGEQVKCPTGKVGLSYKPGQCIDCVDPKNPQFGTKICLGQGDPERHCLEVLDRETNGDVYAA